MSIIYKQIKNFFQPIFWANTNISKEETTANMAVGIRVPNPDSSYSFKGYLSISL
jgi:hypothetical protein